MAKETFAIFSSLLFILFFCQLIFWNYLSNTYNFSTVISSHQSNTLRRSSKNTYIHNFKSYYNPFICNQHYIIIVIYHLNSNHFARLWSSLICYNSFTSSNLYSILFKFCSLSKSVFCYRKQVSLFIVYRLHTNNKISIRKSYSNNTLRNSTNRFYIALRKSN